MTNPHKVKKTTISELRQDLVSGTWVVVATGRAKRPEAFIKEKRREFREKKTACPFCHLDETKQEPDTLILNRGKILPLGKKPKQWSLRVIPNKYPAFIPIKSLNKRQEGPFNIMDGGGFHEVVVTRDHDRAIPQFSKKETDDLCIAYQERYLSLMNKRYINYISIFHNHGQEAGASLAHPHSQLIALPMIDPDIHRSLEGSWNYFRANRRCVHCTMIEWERGSGERVIYENTEFVVICPFVSRTAFEVRIYPKDHRPYFERMHERIRIELADALQVALRKLYKGLDDPSYNFFLHTAPCNGQSYDHYHWHLEIFPKTAIWAGFELSTGIEISTIEPEEAAKHLRKY